ncbi:MAG: hypothetical protein HOP11_14325 [Saprospiraceae bacterium]|nr:hypothetical protein [Saprospiraceae bacterium]
MIDQKKALYIANCKISEGQYGLGGYGQIDLTNLNKHIEENPHLVKNVSFKDGSVHQLINFNIDQKKPEYQTQHQTHSIKLSEPK